MRVRAGASSKRRACRVPALKDGAKRDDGSLDPRGPTLRLVALADVTRLVHVPDPHQMRRVPDGDGRRHRRACHVETPFEAVIEAHRRADALHKEWRRLEAVHARAKRGRLRRKVAQVAPNVHVHTDAPRLGALLGRSAGAAADGGRRRIAAEEQRRKDLCGVLLGLRAVARNGRPTEGVAFALGALLGACQHVGRRWPRRRDAHCCARCSYELGLRHCRRGWQCWFALHLMVARQQHQQKPPQARRCCQHADHTGTAATPDDRDTT